MRSGVTAREKERAERATLVQQEKLSKAKVTSTRPSPTYLPSLCSPQALCSPEGMPFVHTPHPSTAYDTGADALLRDGSTAEAGSTQTGACNAAIVQHIARSYCWVPVIILCSEQLLVCPVI